MGGPWRASVVVRLVEDEGGQDLIEYGLLLATVVAGSVVLFPAIVAGMGTVLGAWGPRLNSLWVPDPPR